jgi:hypothetical protein
MNYPIIVKDIFRYRTEIKEFKYFREPLYFLLIYRFFNKWRFFKNQNDSLKFEIPWITFPAIQYLDRYLNRSMKLFEYGSGGSTIFFSVRVNEVISVEHNVIWFRKLSNHLSEKKIKNVKLKVIEPKPEENAEDIYTSGNDDYKTFSFKNYVVEIDQYPDEYFDIILIDGRARNGCFIHSLRKLKRGGLLVWDNSERPRYNVKFKEDLYPLRRMELPGPTPFSKYFTLTTVFIKT